ncbi:NAD(P)/FAD-dependent oxidoreductase [Streptosporangium sp. NPDC000095]|uniref:NAD(P)/FAD-dependent oxidoreductase n=1 Tax=Streptosporangium sp. NPDC000095 TaxID=3366184 RepID=UPI0036C10CF4
MGILIVGASIAGVRTAQSLRKSGFAGPVTIVGAEPYLPYDKPPVSKDMILPETDGAPVPLLGAEELDALGVDLRVGVRAVALDPVARVVVTDTGEELGYDILVIATGVSPRTLPGAEGLIGVHTMRTVEDALAVRAALPAARHVVAIGAGFIGAEFASAARSHGADVTVVEAQPVPLAHLLGARVGALLGGLHEANGVTLLTGTQVERFEGTGRVTGVTLADGRTLPADLVVVGVGATPATGWLATSGLPVDDGVVCDERLRVRGFDGVYAAGDVARWPHPMYGVEMRIEHWTNANEHAEIVAAAVTGAPAPRVRPPYVWSDQYGHRIQIVGRPGLGRAVRVRTAADDHQVAAVYADEDGTVVAAVVVDDPRLLMRLRRAVMARTPIDALDAPF